MYKISFTVAILDLLANSVALPFATMVLSWCIHGAVHVPLLYKAIQG